jgi:hypothetical protein
VSVNGVGWNPREKNYVTTVGTAKFLPEAFSLDTVNLEVIRARDVVALERADNALIVYMDDVPNGPSEYEFKVHFHPPRPKVARPNPATPATLKIAAKIDGSECLKITRDEAIWEHLGRRNPGKVMLNDVAWFPAQTNVLKNEGTNLFLPATVDLSTARIIGRKGRDLATMWAEPDAIWVRFADNPNGSDHYELEIAFGH